MKFVDERVEVQSPGDTQSGDQFRRGDKTVGGGIGVITTSEVPVVGCDNGVLLAFLDVLTVPLADAGSTSVCKYLYLYLKALLLTISPRH